MRGFMPDQIFYVGAMDDKKKLTGYVPAKFLTIDGQPVVDPMPAGSQDAYIYSDDRGSTKTRGAFANPNNYLIVPANYSQAQAKAFAAEIANSNTVDALRKMYAAFDQGGGQDLQRHPKWGIPKESVVPAFVGSASYHLGSVTGLAGLPPILSEIGGGAANMLNGYVKQPVKRLFGKESTEIDTSGPRFLSQQNHANLTRGISDATAVRNPAWLTNDFGYGAQGRIPAGQIGAGTSIANWVSSLYGLDTTDPTRPAAPQVARPLGIVTNEPTPDWPVPPPIFNTR
jgi:hypothetical protein